MQLTMGQAATECGISKSTLSRAIKAGRISAVRNDAGGFLIDPAELFRVYPPASRNALEPVATGQMAHRATAAEPDDAAVLRAENEGLRAQLATMRELADEMKRHADAWQQQAEAHLLTDQRPRRGILARMFG